MTHDPRCRMTRQIGIIVIVTFAFSIAVLAQGTQEVISALDAPGTTIVTPDDPQHGGIRGPTTRQQRSVAVDVQLAGVATVNAESGCLKRVDTARWSCYSKC
jgi:hypothetical protein